MPVRLEIEYDDDKSRTTINAKDLTDDLRHRWVADGWNHGYSWCKIYGISINVLLEIFDREDANADVFMSIQEEADGGITFYAYRTDPQVVVDMFMDMDGIFVFANWHWDGDRFACTDSSNLSSYWCIDLPPVYPWARKR